MTAGLETWADAKWIHSTLSADTGGGGLIPMMVAAGSSAQEIYLDSLLPNSKLPYVIISHIANFDTQVTEGITILNVANFLVKVVDRADSYSGIVPMYARIHQLLHRQGGLVSEGRIYQAWHLSTVMYPEVREGISYRHLGGRFRLWTGQ